MKLFSRTHRNLANMRLLALLIACGGDSSTNSDNKEANITATLPGGASMDFVWIEPGEFLMGSPEDEVERFDIETQHRVTLTEGFYLGT